MSLADALNTFAEAIKALDARIATLERRCEGCCAAPAPEVAAAPEVAPAPEVAVALADNEALVNLDLYGPDTIQNELWQTFRAISDAGQTIVVSYTGTEDRNIIVYADPATQPTYRNAGLAEVRIIQAIAGTHIASLQPGQSVRTACIEDVWCILA